MGRSLNGLRVSKSSTVQPTVHHDFIRKNTNNDREPQIKLYVRQFVRVQSLIKIKVQTVISIVKENLIQ